MSAPVQLPLPLPAARKAGAPHFIVGAWNREAHALVMNPAAWPGPALSLCGPAASGKSALAHLWCHETGGHHVDAGAFLARDLDALSGTPVALDGLEVIVDPEAVFYLYNRCAAQGLGLLLVSRVPAGQIATPLADLRTRLRAAAVARIGEPDEDDLEALLSHLFEERQIPAGDGLTRFLARRMERSAARAVALVERLDAEALAAGRPVTRDMASALLSAQESAQSGA